MNDLPDELTFKEVCELYGVCENTIRNWYRAGIFPSPKRRGRRMLYWLLSDLQAHEASVPYVREGVSA